VCDCLSRNGPAKHGPSAPVEQVLGESLPKRLYLLYSRNHCCLSILEPPGETLRPKVTQVVLLEVFSSMPDP